MLKVLCAITNLFASITPSHPTSASDFNDYTSYCQKAAEDPEVFAHFKASGIYQIVLEHLNYDQGNQFLNLILEQSPEFLSRIESFRRNDHIGDPTVFVYPQVGKISPSTLRYIKIASDLTLLFGDLNGASIIEIGGGYGGQCKIISDLYNFKKYTIVDLPGPLALTKKYLEAQGVKNVEYKTFDETIYDETFDLLISNYAYTECNSEMQEKYDREILSRSSKGYMISSEQGRKKTETFNRLRSYRIAFSQLPERPQTANSHLPNYTLIWGANPGLLSK